MKRVLIAMLAAVVGLTIFTAPAPASVVRTMPHDCIKNGAGQHKKDKILDYITPTSVPLPRNVDIIYEADVVYNFCWQMKPRQLWDNPESIVGSFHATSEYAFKCKVFQRLKMYFVFKAHHQRKRRVLMIPCDEGASGSSSFVDVPKLPRMYFWHGINGKLHAPRMVVHVKYVLKDPFNDGYYDPLAFKLDSQSKR